MKSTLTTIKLSAEKARELYKTATGEFKTLLEENFDKSVLCPNIKDIIKTMKDVWAYHDLKEENVLPYKNPKTKQQISTNASVKLQYLSLALNEKKKQNWNDSKEDKYLPYFQKKARGGGWAFHFSSYFSSSADLGFGCYFKSRELSDYAGQKFLAVYNEWLPE